MSVKTYDPKNISIIAGSRPIQGYADGEFVTVERNEDAYTLLVGADGESTRAKNANKSGRITITLLASSASNDYLSQLQLTDELSGRGTFGVLIKDHFGSSLYSAATAWIVKQASGSFSKEAGTRQWILETDELLQYAGGNS